MSISDKIAARIKVAAYKPADNIDDRTSLCGEPFKVDDDGRQVAIIPAHTAEYLKKLLPKYEFSEEFEVVEGETDIKPPRKAGRPRK